MQSFDREDPANVIKIFKKGQKGTVPHVTTSFLQL